MIVRKAVSTYFCLFDKLPRTFPAPCPQVQVSKRISSFSWSEFLSQRQIRNWLYFPLCPTNPQVWQVLQENFILFFNSRYSHHLLKCVKSIKFIYISLKCSFSLPWFYLPHEPMLNFNISFLDNTIFKR